MNFEKIEEITKDIMQTNSIESFGNIVAKHLGHFSRDNYVWLFVNFYYCVPDSYLYEIWKDVLCEASGKNYIKLFQERILDKVLLLKNTAALLNYADPNGYITIYHGHCKPSLRYSYSWTLYKDIATWFGHRNAHIQKSNELYVITGKVHIDNVIAYLPDTKNEYEVVTLQKNVKNKYKEIISFNETGLEKPPVMS